MSRRRLRVRAGEHVVVSLDPGADVEADDRAGHAEALRRLDEIDRGVVTPISADELFRRVRQRLAG
jgi:hypothetical protein